MMIRELWISNLLFFVESPLGTLTSWTEITRHQGDALAQKAILQAVAPLVDAQIQYCKNAYEMWNYLKYAYEDVTALQLNTAVREVHQIVPESCESVLEIFDKLVALRTLSIKQGENLPENYWVTEATRLVGHYYPRETCEALQHPKCSLLTMRHHIATFVREPTYSYFNITSKVDPTAKHVYNFDTILWCNWEPTTTILKYTANNLLHITGSQLCTTSVRCIQVSYHLWNSINAESDSISVTISLRYTTIVSI